MNTARLLTIVGLTALLGVTANAADKTDKTDPGNLGDTWVQKLLSFPTDSSPYLDGTGTKCGLGQGGPVWYLFAQGGPIDAPFESACSVPSDKRILLPVLPGFCIPDAGQTLKDCVGGADGSSVLLLQIDGIDRLDLVEHRISNRPFSLTAPKDNIFGLAEGVYRSVADGTFATLPPLAVGDHVIRVQVSFTDNGETQAFDTRYALRIVEIAKTLPPE
jgi:hypothetical protein